jgi:hypothetical protein
MSTHVATHARLTGTALVLGLVLAAASAHAQTSGIAPEAQTPRPAAVAEQSAAPVAQAKPVQTPAPATVTQPGMVTVADRPSAAKGPLEKSANVMFEVTIRYGVKGDVRAESGGIRSATLTIADGNSGTLRAGADVPVPSTTFTPVGKSEPGSAPLAPLTSYQYKTTGMNIDIERVVVEGNRVRANIRVDFSAIDAAGAASSKPAAFPKFLQTFTVVLESGRLLQVAKSVDSLNGAETIQSVEVKATILK